MAGASGGNVRVLVTGATGQLARSLVEAAEDTAGFDVVAIGRPGLDITQVASVAAAIAATRADVVVNAAAYTAVDKAESEPEAARRVNVDGPSNIGSAAHAAGVPVIHVSTDYVYDGRKAAPYVETDETAPVSVYGATKLAGERALTEAAPHHIILRTAWVHSPFGNNFVKTMLRLATTRPEIRVVDDQLGSPTYAPHLADAILKLARTLASRPADQIAWGTYHASGSGETTWCGLAREVFRVSASHGGPAATVTAIGTADYPTPAHRPANSRLDCGKLRREFGVVLPEWREGVAACVARLAQTHFE